MGIYVNPTGRSFELAINSEIFVDKSGLIKETNKCINTLQRYMCVSRPRRFGKSMAMDMLSAYYGRKTDAENLFKGLKEVMMSRMTDILTSMMYSKLICRTF